MLRDITRPNINLVQNTNGIVQFYDTLRNKMLSVTRENLTFGIKHKSIVGKRWMQIVGNIPTNILGYRLPRDATITALTVQTQNSSNCDFVIKKNNLPTAIQTTTMVNMDSRTIDDLNIDLDSGDFLQIELSVFANSVDYPVIFLEIAWR